MNIKQIKKDSSAITYNIYEDACIVECFIPHEDLIKDILAAMRKHRIELDYHTMNNIFMKHCPKPNEEKFWGIAHCHPDSIFDLETGMKVARSKALMKYYKKRIKIMRDITEEVDRELSCCEDALNYSWLSFNEHSKNYQNSLTED